MSQRSLVAECGARSRCTGVSLRPARPPEATRRYARGCRVRELAVNVKGVKDLKAIRVPLPPLSEQFHIAAAVDGLGAFLHACEAALEVAAKRADALRAAILTAAFSGKLAPQDPTDEPASVLLERITSDHAACNGRKRSGTRQSRQEATA